MTSSTGYVGLLGVALMAACGEEEDRCRVEILEPCPGCGSGEVMRAARGETAASARPAGGYVGACDEHLVWHAADFAIERSVAVTDPDRMVAAVAVGPDDVAYFAVRSRGSREQDLDWELGAMTADGDELWRQKLDFFSGSEIELVASGAGVDWCGRQPGDEYDPGDTWVFGRWQANGTRAWTISPEQSGRLFLRHPQLVPRADGGATLFALTEGELELADGTTLGGGPVAIELGPTGGLVSGRHIEALAGAVPYRWAVDADGTMAVIGGYAAELDLGGGVVLSTPDVSARFVARFGPDGTPVWATNVPLPPTVEANGIAMVGDSVVVSGFTYHDADANGQQRAFDGFVLSARDGDVAWRVDAAGPHWERASGLSVTGDGTALVAATLQVSAQIGIEPAIDLGRIHAAMEDEDVPSNLPDDGVVAALAP